MNTDKLLSSKQAISLQTGVILVLELYTIGQNHSAAGQALTFLVRTSVICEYIQVTSVCIGSVKIKKSRKAHTNKLQLTIRQRH